jgi:hypothetical protein
MGTLQPLIDPRGLFQSLKFLQVIPEEVWLIAKKTGEIAMTLMLGSGPAESKVRKVVS